MLFEDWNHPGVVYEGTEEQMRRLEQEGGCPYVIDGVPTTPLPDGTPWELQKAPAHWGADQKPAKLDAEQAARLGSLQVAVARELLEQLRREELAAILVADAIAIKRESSVDADDVRDGLEQAANFVEMLIALHITRGNKLRLMVRPGDRKGWGAAEGWERLGWLLDRMPKKARAKSA